MDATLFPFVFPKFPVPDEEIHDASGLTRAELAAVTVVAVVLIVLIVGIVACCVLHRKNIAVRIGNNVQMIATGAPVAVVHEA